MSSTQYSSSLPYIWNTVCSKVKNLSRPLSCPACIRRSWCQWNRYVWNESQWHVAARIYVWRVDFYLHVTACHLNMLDTFSCKNGVLFFFSSWVLAHPPLVGMRGFIHAMLHIHICSIAGGLPWSPETGAGWHPGQRAGEGHILLCAWTREDDMADNAVDQIKVQQ